MNYRLCPRCLVLVRPKRGLCPLCRKSLRRATEVAVRREELNTDKSRPGPRRGG